MSCRPRMNKVIRLKIDASLFIVSNVHVVRTTGSFGLQCDLGISERDFVTTGNCLLQSTWLLWNKNVCSDGQPFHPFVLAKRIKLPHTSTHLLYRFLIQYTNTSCQLQHRPIIIVNSIYKNRSIIIVSSIYKHRSTIIVNSIYKHRSIIIVNSIYKHKLSIYKQRSIIIVDLSFA
jgi:hypothetical protein